MEIHGLPPAVPPSGGDPSLLSGNLVREIQRVVDLFQRLLTPPSDDKSLNELAEALKSLDRAVHEAAKC
jgi:hypothetical protein